MDFMKYAYFKNEITEFEKATVSIATRSEEHTLNSVTRQSRMPSSA